MSHVASSGTGEPFDPCVAHPARVYNVWLGGKDHYAADRRAAAQVISQRPQVVGAALANRQFLGRAVRYLVRCHGIRQFLDIGTGLPAPGNTHEVAQQADVWSRVVYVDNDPLVMSHARALLTSSDEGSCDYVQADLRDTASAPRLAFPSSPSTRRGGLRWSSAGVMRSWRWSAWMTVRAGSPTCTLSRARPGPAEPRLLSHSWRLSRRRMT